MGSAWTLRTVAVAALASAVGLGAPVAGAQHGAPVSPALQPAERLLLRGETDKAIAQLQSLTAGGKDGGAELLLCRAFASKEVIDQAIAACEAAVAALPASSEAQDRLGRLYGAKADHAGPLSGYSLAKKVRDAFEAAVRLDPANGDAADDLGEFYVSAPSMVGGGLDRAQALEKRLEATMPERAQRLRAEIAEKNKDYGTAEREFRQLAERRNAGDGWMDLATYYMRRKQADDAVAAVKRGIAADTRRDASLVQGASVLLHVERESALGIAALRSYLSGPNMSDAGPACRAHTLLGRLLKATGDTAGARAEFQTALSLAGDYPPAKKELANL